MYTDVNYKTKKAFKEAVLAGCVVGVWDPSPFGGARVDGVVAVEGPHYPEPHRWYAQVTLAGGVVVSVK